MPSSPTKKRKTGPSTDTPNVALSVSSLSSPLVGRIRPSSTPRDLREVYGFAKPPLKFVLTLNENTPTSIRDLYEKLNQTGEGVIPLELKVKILLPPPKTRSDFI